MRLETFRTLRGVNHLITLASTICRSTATAGKGQSHLHPPVTMLAVNRRIVQMILVYDEVEIG